MGADTFDGDISALSLDKDEVLTRNNTIYKDLDPKINDTIRYSCNLFDGDIHHSYYQIVKPPKPDMVNHPPHYQSENGLEVINVIEAFTSDLKGIEAVCTANVLKYICRWNSKNGLEDLKKARWYLDKLIGIREEAENDAER